jgi:hypothetical protein
MGNKIYTPRMMIDRMIVAEPYRVVVGVTGQVGSKENPFREQVIRIGDEPLKSLVSFSKTDNCLHYEFEDNIHLKIMKKDKDIIYHIQTNKINYTSKIRPLYLSKISLKSDELDKMVDFMDIKEGE